MPMLSLNAVAMPARALTDRCRFGDMSGHWASLGFPFGRNHQWRVWLHSRADHGLAKCRRFDNMADALDLIAYHLDGNV